MTEIQFASLLGFLEHNEATADNVDELTSKFFREVVRTGVVAVNETVTRRFP